MRQPEPPALATWMLEHLLWGGRNDALTGDLLEEFERRRSAAWYWRQVFGAIFASFTNELRADWVMVWTIFFTVVWAYALYAFSFIAFPVPMGAFFGIGHFLTTHGHNRKAIWFVTSYTFLYGFPVLFHVATPLGIYLAGAHNLKLRAFLRGLFAAVLVTIALWTLSFQPALDFLSLHGLADYWTQLWKWYEVVVRIMPLLAAMWAAQSGQKETRSILIPGGSQRRAAWRI